MVSFVGLDRVSEKKLVDLSATDVLSKALLSMSPPALVSLFWSGPALPSCF